MTASLILLGYFVLIVMPALPAKVLTPMPYGYWARCMGRDWRNFRIEVGRPYDPLRDANRGWTVRPILGWRIGMFTTSEGIPGRGSMAYYLQIPYWFAIPLLLYWPLRILQLNKRDRLRLNNDLCSRCGYDLRASKDRCPECGTARPSAETLRTNTGQS